MKLKSELKEKREQIQTPEQIITDLHIRYIKNAMAKSGLSTQDSNLQGFDYKGDIRRYLSQYVPQNLIDMVISDYNELIETVDFELLKDLIDRCFALGAESISLEVRESNIVAQGLYTSMGFKKEGKRKGYYEGTEDAIVMILEKEGGSSYEETYIGD